MVDGAVRGERGDGGGVETAEVECHDRAPFSSLSAWRYIWGSSLPTEPSRNVRGNVPKRWPIHQPNVNTDPGNVPSKVWFQAW
ncbi:hypothetical protein GCM10009533_64520 [Saccharopolyspora spinosporotrichia]|uniref:Uncharacterized protein n=1 Tax=Saccharopolyspora erythraea TaxID=1836 RepID=A0ABP3P546_SACER